LAKRLLDRDPQAARREIAEVERVAREALAQVRSAVTGIRAAALVSELASAHLLLESAGVAFDYRAPESTLPADIETALALVLREAVTNIQRHARATQAQVEFALEGDRACMRVRDDGRGGIGAQGNGLTGMRERIETMGGTLAIHSERGHGTKLEIVLPLPAVRESEPARTAARNHVAVATLRQA
jgi:two-component system sensor histidine kinase DesK